MKEKDLKIRLLEAKIKMLLTEKETLEEYVEGLEELIMERDKEIQTLGGNVEYGR